MAKRLKGLNSLIKRFPTPEEALQVLGSLNDQPDRSYAIMAAAMLDGMLEKLIIQRLPKKDPELLRRLFEDRGPLYSLDSKIHMAKALDVVMDGLADDMVLVKRIRNAFAHAPGTISFDTKEIAETIQRTSFVKYFQDSEYEGDPKPGNRIAFSIIATWLLMTLSDMHFENGGEQLIKAIDLTVDE